MHGQNLQEIYLILREHPTYLLWTILAGFQLFASNYQ